MPIPATLKNPHRAHDLTVGLFLFCWVPSTKRFCQASLFPVFTCQIGSPPKLTITNSIFFKHITPQPPPPSHPQTCRVLNYKPRGKDTGWCPVIESALGRGPRISSRQSAWLSASLGRWMLLSQPRFRLHQ